MAALILLGVIAFIWIVSPRHRAAQAAPSSLVDTVLREADSLDDYANEVGSPLTAAVLRKSAARLRAASRPSVPESLSDEQRR